MKQYRWLFLILTITFSVNLKAQQARETFGKNRMQYKTFDWRYYSTENFDVYFYGRGDKIAKEAISFIETEFNRFTEVVGYSPYSKTKIFLYNSISDLQQSNVGVNEALFSVGGQTNFVKSYVEIAHPGTITGLKKELKYRVASLLIDDMLFGGSFGDSWQNTFLLNLPEWFVEGAKNYIAYGWDIEMDDNIRDLIANARINKLNKFEGADASVIGHSIWNFIVQKYGKSNVQNILNLTRITRNEEKSLTHTLGIPFKQFLIEWKGYYIDMAVYVQNSYKAPLDEEVLKIKTKSYSHFNQTKLSPDGSKLAYVINDNGRYTIMIRDLATQKDSKIVSGGYKVINQEIDYSIPVFSWSDENTLGYVNVVKGITTFWLYDIPSKSKIATPLRNFENVKWISFNGNGRLAILSADRRGKNDLYLMSVRRGRVRQITNDHFDDIYPEFIPNSNSFVFSSNRNTTDIRSDEEDIKKISESNFNLYVYDLDTTRNELAKITNTISKDIHPIPKSETEFYYLSDQKGIVNVFRYSTVDSLYKQVTNYQTSIKDFDLNFESNQFAAINLNKRQQNVFYSPSINLNQNVFTPLTRRQQVMQAKFITERRKVRDQKEQTRSQEPVKLNFGLQLKTDTTSVDSTGVDDTQPEAISDLGDEGLGDVVEDSEIIDTDNYTFDKEVLDDNKQTESFLSRFRRMETTSSEIIGPLPYETRFTANNLVTSMVIDPLRGFGILLETQLNDQLENHRFYGGFMATTDLRSGDVFAEYEYLKYLVDYNVRYDRKVIYWNSESALQRYSLNTFEVGASLPLSVKTRATFKPFYSFARYEDLDPSLLNPGPPEPANIGTSYLGVKSELIFDNTVVSGMNMMDGTRMKLEFIHREAVSDRSKSFTNISVDIRNYQKLHREIVFATRFFYGVFFGQNPQSYLLGGMDNWFFNQTNEEGADNPLNVEGNVDNSHLLFLEYVTSLRGFEYSTFNGTNSVLFNAELRIPIVQYLVRGPISSNFFKNLQLVGFFDLGSAWTGPSPFNKENSVNTDIIANPGSPFQAEIQNFKNPWLMGYGVGLRTVMLGYYLKFDLGWPIVDYDVGKPKFYVTLGYDF